MIRPRRLLAGMALLAGTLGLWGPDRAALASEPVGAGDTILADDAPRDSGGVNDPALRDTPVVVLVSIDGYRWDFPERYPSPSIRRLAGDGLRAHSLRPTWPTLTFPNHYSLVTGLSPAQHGIVGNEFPAASKGRWYSIRDRDAVEDGRWYGGEPLWVTLERRGLVTATYFWVGSEAAVGGVRPTHWHRYDKQVPADARVNQALAWLDLPAETRPHLITLYFEGVDDNAHWYGVGSEPFREALEEVDRALGRLMDGIDILPYANKVTLVLVSDHGQMGYHDDPPFILEEHLYLDGLALIDKGAAVYAWQGHPDPVAAERLAQTVNTVWTHGRAYTRASAPADWGLDANPRFPDLVFQADPGYAVLSRPERQRSINPGDHGWAPDAPEMHGVFMARGPGIVPGTSLGETPSTAVHGYLLDWLGLTVNREGATADSAPAAE